LISFGTVVSKAIEQYSATIDADRIRLIAYVARQADPVAWRNLTASTSLEPSGQSAAEGRTALVKTIREELVELGDFCFAVYGPDGRRRIVIPYRDDAREACPMVRRSLITDVLGDGEPVLIEELAGPGTWSTIARLTQVATEGPVAVALTGPAAPGERFTDRFLRSWGIVFAAGLLLSIVVATLLVRQAQGQINQRSAQVARLRRELERYVSATTVRAITAAEGKDIEPQRIACTMLFADIRDFSSFAETASPVEVGALVNEIMDISIAIVERHGGDVDGIEGDALLAVFEGEDRRKHALCAARELVDAVERSPLPRGIGIGLHDGSVVRAVVGSHQRRALTVHGRAVNQASRLCGAARRAEVVASFEALGGADADALGFGPPEAISIKGHVSVMTVRRWTLPQKQESLASTGENGRAAHASRK
jgi:class 3 adenylate cyclase